MASKICYGYCMSSNNDILDALWREKTSVKQAQKRKNSLCLEIKFHYSPACSRVWIISNRVGSVDQQSTVNRQESKAKQEKVLQLELNFNWVFYKKSETCSRKAQEACD